MQLNVPRVRTILFAGVVPAWLTFMPREVLAEELDYRVGMEASGYHDDMDVDVLTPSVRAGVEHVTDGWGIEAGLLVDVVSAASADIVATASPRWTEVRYVPTLSAHHRFGDVDVSVSGSLSHEPDYLSGTVGGRISFDVASKMVTPSFGYSYSHDINGKAGTPFAVFGLPIHRHALDAGVALVLGRATQLSLSGTVIIEDGDTSKPYRHVPMFEPHQLASIAPGMPQAEVNLLRIDERPLEQLPTSRQRYALAGLLAHRFSGSTLRLDERLYRDSWGVMATTTDAQYIIDAGDHVRLWPHGRFHLQSGADFYEMAYTVERDEVGDALIPALRTGDRELGALWAATVGGGVHFDLTSRWGLGVMGDAIYTRFEEHLFVTDRWGAFGAITLEGTF